MIPTPTPGIYFTQEVLRQTSAVWLPIVGACIVLGIVLFWVVYTLKRAQNGG